jgi:hypothetical protein
VDNRKDEGDGEVKITNAEHISNKAVEVLEGDEPNASDECEWCKYCEG